MAATALKSLVEILGEPRLSEPPPGWKSTQEIGQEYGLSPVTVNRKLLAAGVERVKVKVGATQPTYFYNVK